MQAELRPPRYEVIDLSGEMRDWTAPLWALQEIYPDAVFKRAEVQGVRIPKANYLEFDFGEGGEGTVLVQGQILVIAPDKSYEVLFQADYNEKYRTLRTEERTHSDNATRG